MELGSKCTGGKEGLFDEPSDQGVKSGFNAALSIKSIETYFGQARNETSFLINSKISSLGSDNTSIFLFITLILASISKLSITVTIQVQSGYSDNVIQLDDNTGNCLSTLGTKSMFDGSHLGAPPEVPLSDIFQTLSQKPEKGITQCVILDKDIFLKTPESLSSTESPKSVLHHDQSIQS